MKILIFTDLEGVSGIVDWDKTPDITAAEKEYQEFLLTNEVNGAVEGAFRAGVSEVWVVECHGIDIREIHPDAYLLKISTEKTPLSPEIIGMRPGRWDAMAFIGNHSMAGTPFGVLSHTQNNRVKAAYINDKLVGEFGIQAAIAGALGMPMIMVSGDEAACMQAQALIPEIETAVVKYGTGRHSAWCLSPKKAKVLIAGKMEKAVGELKSIKPYDVGTPVLFREEYYDGTVREIKAGNMAEVFNERARKILNR